MSDTGAQRGLRDDEPLMVAWNAYKVTPEFANTKKWATDLNWICRHPEAVDGNLWAAFMAGCIAAGGVMEP